MTEINSNAEDTLAAATPRGRYSDTHIAACAAAEACPCRAKEAQHRLASA